MPTGADPIAVPGGLRAALATADLRRLQLGWAASSVGGWAFMVGLSVYAYGVGGAAAVGLAAFVRMLPAAVAAPLAGMLADRHSRRDVLVWVCVARALGLGATALAVAAGAPFAAVLVLAALVTMAQAAHKPAQAALLPALTRNPGELAAANALWSAVDNAGFLVGALLGGVLVAAASTSATLAATAALLVVAAATLARVTRDPVPAHRRERSSSIHEIEQGLRAVRGDGALSLVVGVIAATTFVEGIVDVLVVVAALGILGLGDAGVGWLNAAWGAGGLAGGAVALALLRRSGLSASLVRGGVLAGASLIVIAGLPEPAVGVAMLVAFGAGYALIEIAGLSLIGRLAGDELLGRAFAATEGLYWITTGLGSAVAPLLCGWIGVRGALAAAGAGLVLAVAARGRALVRLERARPVAPRAFALLRAVSFLAPLPLVTIESLALRLRPCTVEAGDAAIREGDVGDRFYIVDAGEVEVHRRGRSIARLGPGSCFGEIALLHDVPRTATVTAIGGPAALLALDRGEFLAAVTGHPRAAQAADAFATDRAEAARVA